MGREKVEEEAVAGGGRREKREGLRRVELEENEDKMGIFWV